MYFLITTWRLGQLTLCLIYLRFQTWIALFVTLQFPSAPASISWSCAHGFAAGSARYRVSIFNSFAAKLCLGFGVGFHAFAAKLCQFSVGNLQPFFGWETPTAFRRSVGIPFSSPKSGCSFLSEKRLAIPNRKLTQLNPIWRQPFPVESLNPHPDLLRSGAEEWPDIHNRKLVELGSESDTGVLDGARDHCMENETPHCM